MKAMMQSDETSVPIEQIRSWLRREIMGCAFPRVGITAGNVVFVQATEELAIEELNASCIGAESAGSVIVLVFPYINSRVAFDSLIHAIDADASWNVSATESSGQRYIRIQKVLQSGATSEVLGLAPFIEMPITRRAPHVSLVIWCGGAENVHRNQPSRIIGLADSSIANGVEKSKFDELWERSKESTTSMIPSDAVRKRLRATTFVISS